MEGKHEQEPAWWFPREGQGKAGYAGLGWTRLSHFSMLRGTGAVVVWHPALGDEGRQRVTRSVRAAYRRPRAGARDRVAQV